MVLNLFLHAPWADHSQRLNPPSARRRTSAGLKWNRKNEKRTTMPSLFYFYRVECLSRFCFCLLLVLLAMFFGVWREGGRRDAGRLQIRSKSRLVSWVLKRRRWVVFFITRRSFKPACTVKKRGVGGGVATPRFCKNLNRACTIGPIDKL